MRVPTSSGTGRGTRTKVTPTFTDMLGALRLQMWEYEVFGESGEEVALAGMHRKAAPQAVRSGLRSESLVWGPRARPVLRELRGQHVALHAAQG